MRKQKYISSVTRKRASLGMGYSLRECALIYGTVKRIYVADDFCISLYFGDDDAKFLIDRVLRRVGAGRGDGLSQRIPELKTDERPYHRKGDGKPQHDTQHACTQKYAGKRWVAGGYVRRLLTVLAGDSFSGTHKGVLR